jgi:DNA-directed RNA polymerase specialized sigma24 family protein
MAAPLVVSIPQHLCSLAIEELSDKQLLQRFAGSADEAAFAALVHRHGKLVFGVGRRILGPGPAVDSVFQATFLVLARKPATIRKHASVASWLWSVARGLAFQLTPGCDQPNQKVTALGEVLDEELERLPAGWRDALVLCHLEGLGTAEAAQRLEWPPSLLQGRLQRARDLLRRRLHSRGVKLSAMGLVIALAEHAGAAVPTALLRTTLTCAAAATPPSTIAALAEMAAAALAPRRLKFA